MAVGNLALIPFLLLLPLPTLTPHPHQSEMILYQTIYDISVLLGEEAIDYPGDPPFRREMLYALRNGDAADVSQLSMSAHAGAHLDAPAHFFDRPEYAIDRYPVQTFILPAMVAPIKDSQTIRPRELEGVEIHPGDALLFKTANSLDGRCKSGMFREDFVDISPETADFCLAQGVKLVGIDYVSVERHGDGTYPVHHKLLGNNVFILEGINLAEVPPGRYTLICLPLKIKGGEASPVRAVLLR